jgi:hypothetical protein
MIDNYKLQSLRLSSPAYRYSSERPVSSVALIRGFWGALAALESHPPITPITPIVFLNS